MKVKKLLLSHIFETGKYSNSIPMDEYNIDSRKVIKSDKPEKRSILSILLLRARNHLSMQRQSLL
jgi:hypothetical protein